MPAESVPDRAAETGPLFTVAIPCYNRADMIGQTLESVFAQTFTDYEIVCVNDGSTDDTLEVLRRYEAPESGGVRVIDQQNTGLAGARNTGAEHARGTYVIFLDSDDLFFPWSLEALAEAARAHESAEHGLPAMVAGEFRAFTELSDLDRWRRTPTRARAFPDYVSTRARACGIAPSGAAVRTDVYRAAGGGEEVRVMFEDVEIWFKNGVAPGFVFVDEPSVVGYRVGHAQMMGNMKKQADGFDWIAGKVRDGTLPDGGARRREMEDALALHAKSCAFRCIHAGDRARGLWFYRRTLPWQVRNGEWRFVLGFPVTWALGRAPTSRGMRDKAKQVVSDE